MNNNLLNLSQDLLSSIYEFDSTYKEKFSNDVLPNIWLASWKFAYSDMIKNTNKNCFSFMHEFVFEYLITSWGVPNSIHKMQKRTFTNGLENIFFKDQYSTYLGIYEYEGVFIGHFVRVSLRCNPYTDLEVFYGVILRHKEYQNKTYQLHYNSIMYEIFQDKELGLYLFQLMPGQPYTHVGQNYINM
jgi:hypothetical protein